MLFKNDVPSALEKLNEVIAPVSELSRAYVSNASHQKGLLVPEYGLYFIGPQRKQVLWFGMWADFWEEHGYPLSFGVQNKWPAKDRFLQSYKGPRMEFGGYTLAWITQETLASEDPACEIWKQLEPVLEAVVALRADSLSSQGGWDPVEKSHPLHFTTLKTNNGPIKQTTVKT